MLMTSFLGHALDLEAPWEPGAVLAAVNRKVKDTLGQGFRAQSLHLLNRDGSIGLADEGMDVTCIWFDLQESRAAFSGARHSLWVFRPGADEPEEIKGERMGVGYVTTPDAHVWGCTQLDFAPGTVLMGTTDGILDQIGGPQRISFGRRRLWETFLDAAGRGGLQDRLEACAQALARYQGLEARRDDVSFFAVEC
jgi:serine phosphatase RsbU (regulator of sigma subunit)